VTKVDALGHNRERTTADGGCWHVLKTSRRMKPELHNEAAKTKEGNK
jgi:hypothetical protein